jgi:hypothetical protein
MTITQTVEIPADRRLTIEVPREVPTGKTVLIFKSDDDAFDRKKGEEAINHCSGLARRMGINLSSDDFLEMRRKDKELEDRLDSSI